MTEINKRLIPRAFQRKRPRYKFGSVCFFLRSVTNRRRGYGACVVCATDAHGRVMADGVKVSLVTVNIMESKTFKTHTNAYISQGRPTFRDVEHFRKGSVREIYERSIYERTFTSEPFIVNHAITALSNELSIENHAISNQLSPVSLRRNRRVG